MTELPPNELSLQIAGRNLLIILLILVLPMVGIFAVNVTVDPLLYRWPRAAWLPTPAYVVYDRETHLNLIAHTRPASLILGSSQAQHGLAPAHWRTQGPVVNGGMVAAKLPDIRRALDMAIGGGNLKTAIVDLDFTMGHLPPGVPPTTDNDYVVGEDGRMGPSTVLSLATFPLFSASFGLLRQLKGKRPYFSNDGRSLPSLYRDSIQKVGTLGALARNLLGLQKNLEEPGSDFSAQLSALRDKACAHGVRLEVFFPPLHVTTIEELLALNQISNWEDWKRTVVRISDERPGCHFAVWDFNTVNPVTTEPLPPFGVQDGLTNSWDGVHFKVAVGDQILARLQGTSPAAGFGVRLTASNLEAALRQDRLALATYVGANPTAPSYRSIIDAWGRIK